MTVKSSQLERRTPEAHVWLRGDVRLRPRAARDQTMKLVSH